MALQRDGFAAEFSGSVQSQLTGGNHLAFDAGWVRSAYKAKTFTESTDEATWNSWRPRTPSSWTIGQVGWVTPMRLAHHLLHQPWARGTSVR